MLKYRSRVISNGKIIGGKDNTAHIYSLESVVDCLTKGTFKNYWNATETIEALKKPINRNEEGLNEIISILIYKGNIILVGINYDSDIKNDVVNYKHHSCMIERV